MKPLAHSLRGIGVEDPADGARSADGRLVPAGIPGQLKAM
jgi:hypothetical protein